MGCLYARRTCVLEYIHLQPTQATTQLCVNTSKAAFNKSKRCLSSESPKPKTCFAKCREAAFATPRPFRFSSGRLGQNDLFDMSSESIFRLGTEPLPYRRIRSSTERAKSYFFTGRCRGLTTLGYNPPEGGSGNASGFAKLQQTTRRAKKKMSLAL